MERRAFLFTALGAAAPFLAADDLADPWRKSDLIEPSDLAKILNTTKNRPAILFVGFSVMYRQKRIIHAELAGPANKPDGMAALKEEAAKLAKDQEIVIYCGCCPMVHCPNIRPAYRTLKQLGYTHIRVLDLPTNFHTDWAAKGYPVEAQVGVPATTPPK